MKQSGSENAKKAIAHGSDEDFVTLLASVVSSLNLES